MHQHNQPCVSRAFNVTKCYWHWPCGFSAIIIVASVVYQFFSAFFPFRALWRFCAGEKWNWFRLFVSLRKQQPRENVHLKASCMRGKHNFASLGMRVHWYRKSHCSGDHHLACLPCPDYINQKAHTRSHLRREASNFALPLVLEWKSSALLNSLSVSTRTFFRHKHTSIPTSNVFSVRFLRQRRKHLEASSLPAPRLRPVTVCVIVSWG